MNWQSIIKELSKDQRPTLQSYIKKIATKPVYIYGAGCFGRELQAVFQRYGVEVHGFLDKNADSCKPALLPIYYPEAVNNKQSVNVVLGIVLNLSVRQEIEKYLRDIGYEQIIDGQSVRAHYVYALTEDGEEKPAPYFEGKVPEIERAMELLADDESRATYVQNITAHLKRDYSHCYQTTQEHQYFVDDVPFVKGYSRFVDCGAYIGDTLEDLIRLKGKVEAVAAFEPNVDNFVRLSANYDGQLHEHISQGVFFPCGVADSVAIRKFAPAAGSSAISEKGDELVQCVNLDAVLKDLAPTFIKMDIEGAEYAALQGAKNMIARYKPDLAVSVYHIIDDFWRIPLLIDSWRLGYRFYLRTHSSCCMETILYAVCPEEV